MYRPDDYPELDGKEPDWVASEREMFTTQRDKDSDGKLNKQEMTEWIMPTGFDHAEAEARHLIHMADDDKVTILLSTFDSTIIVVILWKVANCLDNYTVLYVRRYSN